MLSTPSLSNWIKFEPALSPTLLCLWPPETVIRFQVRSFPRLMTFSCLRPESTDAFDPYPAYKIPSSSFHDEGAKPDLWGCTFWCNSFSHQYNRCFGNKAVWKYLYIIFDNFLSVSNMNLFVLDTCCPSLNTELL